MNNRIKKISAPVLLVLAIFPLLATMFLLFREMRQVAFMKARLKSELLVTVQHDFHEIVWLENGKEVLINGRMFDVESWSQTGNTVCLKGLYDTQEEHIRDLIHRAQSNSPVSRPTIALLGLLFAPAIPVNPFQHKAPLTGGLLLHLKNAYYLSGYLSPPMPDVQAPPPDFM